MVKVKSMTREQKRVLKEYPNAKCTMDDNGHFIVIVDDVVLAEEYFLPPALDNLAAWANASIACKTTQNFNRTHPLRAEFASSKETKKRINRRRNRNMDYYGLFDND
jgi:hypothetical protein